MEAEATAMGAGALDSGAVLAADRCMEVPARPLEEGACAETDFGAGVLATVPTARLLRIPVLDAVTTLWGTVVGCITCAGLGTVTTDTLECFLTELREEATVATGVDLSGRGVLADAVIALEVTCEVTRAVLGGAAFVGGGSIITGSTLIIFCAEATCTA